MKKGYLFSIFVITALVLIVVIYKNKVEFQNENRAEVFKRRISASNAFIADMEKDMERSLYISSFRAFVGVSEVIHKQNTYFPNLTSYMPEMIWNGTFNSTNVGATKYSTFSNWTAQINLLARRFNLNLTFSNVTFQINQSDPFTINVSFYAIANMRDNENLVNWNYTVRESTLVDISEAGFEDPTYFIESKKNNPKAAAPMFNTVKKTTNMQFWNNDSGTVNASGLYDQMINQYYVNNSRAPSFFMRLEGNFNCDEEPYIDICNKNGIESLVNVVNDANVFEYSAEQQETCASDYQFFTGNCEGVPVMIANMSDRFLLDNWHINNIYNLSSIKRIE